MMLESGTKIIRTYFLILFVPFFFVLQSFCNAPVLSDRTDYIAPPLELKYLNIGFATQASDSFWIRAVQDIDYCDKLGDNNTCVGKSWLFNVINLTVELDNKFREAFYYGSLSLTILISDYAGASVIFDKGVVSFPNDWPLLYAAGYHALFEEKDKMKASRLFYRAAEHGAPNWLRLSAGRLASEVGEKEFAEQVLQRLVGLESDPVWVEKLKKKIESINKTD